MSERMLQFTAVFAAMVCVGICGCSSTTPARTTKQDGSQAVASGSGGNKTDAALGAGGALGGSGGMPAMDAPVTTGGTSATGGGSGGRTTTATGGSDLDGGARDLGGKIGTGGSYVDGGAHGSGGKIGTGGTVVDGGAPSSGGKLGSGGMVGTGGTTGVDAGPTPICGTEMGIVCPTGQFCDISDHCGMISDGAGDCKLTGPTVGCPDIYLPVCGCNGKTYPSDCDRAAAGVQKFSDGACVGGRDGGTADSNLGLAWQANTGSTGTGPGIIVLGKGWYAAGTSTSWQDYQAMIFDGTPSYGLSNAQLSDLSARLAALDLTSLPHASAGTSNCSAMLTFSTCSSCKTQTLAYSSSTQLAPEMEHVWAWFDQVLGSSSAAINPRTYCAN